MNSFEIILVNTLQSHKLITVLFCYTLDFKDAIQKLSPTEIVQAINQMIVIFDQCSEKYDVFKVMRRVFFRWKIFICGEIQVETKADSSYMVVAGIQDRGIQRRISTSVEEFHRIDFVL